MDSINDIISSLSSDDIEMLKGVANSIINSENSSNNQTQPKQDSSNILSLLNSNNSQNNNNTNSNSNNPLGLSINDFNMILKAKSIFEKMNSKNSKNADLIRALKPHLSSKSQDKADQAIKMLQLFEVMPYLKELF